LHYPEVKISGSSDKEGVDPKYFSMIIPTKMTSESQSYRYFLRKGELKTDNESMIEFDDEIIKLIIEACTKTFFPFLKKLNGQRFSSLQEVPQKPDFVVLKEIDEKTKLVFRLDDFQIPNEKRCQQNHAKFFNSNLEKEFFQK